MNARPTLQFKFALASHLKKTVAEIDAMDSREFSQWIAYARWFQPLDNPWKQTGNLIHYSLFPHLGGKVPPSPETFIPIEDKAPKHPTQIRDTIRRMAEDLKQRD
jgi:hypothetical protein